LEKPAASRRGDFVAWTGGCGFIGEGGRGPIAPHSHYAIQLVIGAPTGLRVQFGRNGPWQSCAAALVPSRATHSIDVNDCDMSAVLFIEPETPEGKALSARLQGQLELLDADQVAVGAKRLERAWRIEKSYDTVKAVCLQLVQEISRTTFREPSDPRVLAAIEHIRQRVNQPVALAEVAKAANLSPSRFRHLFVEETGMPLRTYVLWRRLLHVWTLLMQGETLSMAAHAAGFADSAHLSRTARTMFGLPPSALNVNGPLSARSRMPQHHLG
jgi:AraC family transcriptional regulator